MNEKIVTFDMRGEAVRSLEPWEPLSKSFGRPPSSGRTKPWR